MLVELVRLLMLCWRHHDRQAWLLLLLVWAGRAVIHLHQQNKRVLLNSDAATPSPTTPELHLHLH
jgi:hypothetical protein